MRKMSHTENEKDDVMVARIARAFEEERAM